MLRVLGEAKFYSPRAFNCEILGSQFVSEIEIYLNDLSNPGFKNNLEHAVVVVVTEKLQRIGRLFFILIAWISKLSQTTADPEVFHIKAILNTEEKKTKCISKVELFGMETKILSKILRVYFLFFFFLRFF